MEPHVESPAAPYEPPRAPPPARLARLRRSRAAGKLAFESALLVASVALGFAVSAWNQRAADRTLVRTATDNFRRELRRNLTQLERAQPRHAALVARLDSAARAATARPGETAFDVFVAVMPRDGMGTEPLRDAAWETAGSTGALRLMDYDVASRLSEVYSMQQGTYVQDIQRFVDRLESPESFDPAARRRMLLTFRLLMAELSGFETGLMSAYRDALKPLDARTP